MLYIVPTPIGNLDDITVRAKKVFEKAKIVLCEDGKITAKLFQLLEIKNKPHFVNIVRNNVFNTSGVTKALENIIGTNTDTNLNNTIHIFANLSLENDEQVVAMVSDAGTPGISDPGYETIALAQKLAVQYTVLPGATAFVPSAVVSNLISKEFIFWGFLPLKKGRQTAWKELNNSQLPVIMYESVHRIAKWIEEAQVYLSPSTQICISQEISKKHENHWIGTTSELSIYPLVEKGEFVITVRN